MTLRVLVLAPLRADLDHAADERWTRPIRFEHATFEGTMANFGPRVSLVRSDKTREERHFRTLSSFDESLAAPSPIASLGASLLDDILDATEETARAEDPVLRSLAIAWRGLAFLVAHASADVVVEAIDAAHDDVGDVLEAFARSGASYDLLVVDHIIDTSARDLDRLVRWAELAEGMNAPLVCGGSPGLVGLDDLGALARSERRLRSSDEPRAVRFRSLAAKDPLRWVALALNGTGSVRAPHVLASLALDAFARIGWAAGLERSVVSGVKLEASATEDAALEAAAAGLTLLIEAPGGVRVARAPVAFREPSRGGGTSPAASLGLGDQLFLTQLSRTILELAAEIPSNTPENIVRETATVALHELFGDAALRPRFDVVVRGTPAVLEVTVHPRGFAGVGLEEATLGAALATPV